MFFDPMYLIFVSPALLLMMWAQYRVKSTFNYAMRVPARMSGAEAARFILDRAGLTQVGIEQTGGFLTDHYDPSSRVLRLSPPVYQSHSAAAVGIAAHEAGHALQHAHNYSPLVLRNAAVPAARFGPMLAMLLFILGALMRSQEMIIFGLIAFGGIVVFQLINLPVEFDASNRAKQLLEEYDVLHDRDGHAAVRSVLNAAGWTYVAGTLQSVLQLLYYAHLFLGRGNDRERS